MIPCKGGIRAFALLPAGVPGLSDSASVEASVGSSLALTHTKANWRVNATCIA